MAHTKSSTAKPAPTTFDVTHTLASAKPATCGDAHTMLVTTYGDEVADRFASTGCKRLPRHEVTELKGHKAVKPLGLMTSRQRAAYKASVASKLATSNTPRKPDKAAKPTTVVVDGVTYRVGPKVRETAEAPVFTATPAAKRRVRTLRSVPAERRVAAPAHVTRRPKTAKPSGQPSAHLA